MTNKAYVFPGQGSQFQGMGKELYEQSNKAKKLFETANDLLGFRISDTMFNGTEQELKQTKVTQPAIFLHSVVVLNLMGESFKPTMVAGHSLGEYTALVANQVLSFEEGLKLVAKRAQYMQQACENNKSTMAVVLGLGDEVVEQVCETVEGVVVPANYNCPGQIVISGAINAIEEACEILKSKGAKRAMRLPVSGAFHSPLMQGAEQALAEAINQTKFSEAVCPIYQNVCAKPVTNTQEIKENLTKQLTASVRWTQSVNQMIADGCASFTEVGPGKVLQGLVKKINRDVEVSQGKIAVEA